VSQRKCLTAKEPLIKFEPDARIPSVAKAGAYLQLCVATKVVPFQNVELFTGSLTIEHLVESVNDILLILLSQAGGN
jgi:hypothetical protein